MVVGKGKKNSIDTVSLLEKTEEARDRLYRFQYVTAALTQAITPMQIAEIIVSLGAATLHATAGSVWLFDPKGDLSLVAYTGYDKDQIEKITLYRQQGSTPTQDAIRYKRPILIHSLKERERLYPHTSLFFTELSREGYIAIPLVIGKAILGAVNFAFQKPQTFTLEEQEFIYAVVQQCTQALDHASLYNDALEKKIELQNVIKRINSLQKVTTLLSKALTAEEMANIIIREGISTLGALGGEVCTLTQNKEHVKILSEIGYPESYMKLHHEKEFSTKEPLLVMDTINKRKPLIIEDFSKISPNYSTAKEFIQTSGFHSGIFIPLLSESKLRGVLTLYFGKEYQSKDEDIHFLTTLAKQFVQAYDRAKIYEKESSHRKKLEYLFKKLIVLQEVTKVLSSAVTLEDVLNTILKRGVKALGAMGGEISILSEDNKLFRVVAYRGYPKEFTKNFTKEWRDLSHRQPLLMWDVVKEKKAVFLTDISDVPQRYKLSRKFSQITNAQSSAIVPLIVNGKAFGIFYLLFKKTNNFIDDDKEFIFTLAQHASQALERARIYENERQTTESLRQSEENWKQLAETIPHLVWTGNSNGDITYYNKHWEDYTGLSFKGIVKMGGWRALAYPEDLVRIQPTWDKAVKQKRPYEVEYRLRSKTGEYRWFISKALPIKNKSGDIVRWFGTLTDINEQKLVHIEVEKREARFRTLIENSSDAISLIDEKGVILYSSPSTSRIMGYTPEERLGKAFFSMVYPKDRTKMKKFIRQLRDSSQDTLLSITYRQINKNGSIPWIEGIGRNLLHNPDIKAMVINYRDVTERIESANAIQQAKEELEIIFENVADAIVVWSGKGEILYCNHAAAILNKYESTEEFINDSTYSNFLTRFESIFDEEEKPIPEENLTIPSSIRLKKPVQQVDKIIFREDHTEQWRKVKTAPILDNQGNVQLLVTVIQDITIEKRKENTKDEFISTASHELKTPITSAKLYAGILSEKLQQKGDEKNYSIVAKLDTQLNRLTKLINDLLDLTKIRSGRILFTKEYVSIERLIKDIVEEMQYTTITHRLSFSGTSDKLFFLDEERLRQVFVNLINNAIKYSPHANKVDVSLKDTDGGIIIYVKDYGVGIAKNDQKKIFQPFYRSVVSTTSFPGLGLGLHIASEIVRSHGGNIKVESTLEKGTTMIVFLPEK